MGATGTNSEGGRSPRACPSQWLWGVICSEIGPRGRALRSRRSPSRRGRCVAGGALLWAGLVGGSGLCPRASELVPGRKSTGGQQGAREAPQPVGWLREDEGRGPGNPGEAGPALTKGGKWQPGVPGPCRSPSHLPQVWAARGRFYNASAPRPGSRPTVGPSSHPRRKIQRTDRPLLCTDGQGQC